MNRTTTATVSTRPIQQQAQQLGAMAGSTAPVDLDVVRCYRLKRVRDALRQRDLAGIILYDPLNTRYATDSTDMQLWCTHNETRCVYVACEGPVVVFEYGITPHLSAGLPGVDEVRSHRSSFYMAAGGRHEERARQWAAEMADLIRTHSGGNTRIAIDRIAPKALHAIENEGFSVADGFEVMENARVIKSSEELVLMKAAIEVAERGISAMHNALCPGITENALWSLLHQKNIELGGEWIETRLLSSGPRTNPWMQESSMRIIEAGDMVSFDTDLIGPYGYCADISRSWVCGTEEGYRRQQPTDEQRRLYAHAYAQIEHNTALVKAGVGFREFAQKAWVVPDEFLQNRYGCLFHGIGLCDEYPSGVFEVDFLADNGSDGILQAGMTICIESLIGAVGGRESVKLEQQVLVTEQGCEVLSSYPFEAALL